MMNSLLSKLYCLDSVRDGLLYINADEIDKHLEVMSNMMPVDITASNNYNKKCLLLSTERERRGFEDVFYYNKNFIKNVKDGVFLDIISGIRQTMNNRLDYQYHNPLVECFRLSKRLICHVQCPGFWDEEDDE